MEQKRYKTDVFISYKHADLDMMVSNWLQKNIEHYRIPKDIQIKSGKKSISKVFRDVEDLSVGNDLGKEIENQLQNSEFLIVVCSPNAKKSEWVNREIRTFLKHHPSENILPIIIEGEPEEAFPEALLQLGEPFAADVRADDQKKVMAKLKNEYIRLMAPILYCSYDELVQRNRRYQYQRLLIISSIILVALSGFSGYAIYQNYRTNLALKNSQISESKYLASQAGELFASNDYVSAMELNLKALPSYKGERPIVPEALYNLTSALGLYQDHLYDPDMYPFKSNYKLLLPDTISEDFIVDKTGEYVIAYDRQKVYIYNTELNMIENVITFSYGDAISRVIYNQEENRVYVGAPKNLFCFDCVSGEQLWRVNTVEEIQQFLVNDHLNELVLVTDSAVNVVDLNGKVKERRFLNLPEGVIISDDKKSAAFSLDDNTILLMGETSNSQKIVYLYDIKNDVLSECCYLNSNEVVAGFFDASTYYLIHQEGDRYIDLILYRVGQSEPIWQTKMNEKMSLASAELMKMDDGNIGVIVGLGRTTFVFNYFTGEDAGAYEFNNDLAKVVVLNNQLLILQKNGEFKYVELDNNLNHVAHGVLRSVDNSNIDDIVYAAKGDYEQCFVRNGNAIYQYDTLIEDDPNYTFIDMPVDSMDASVLKPECYVVLKDNTVQYMIGENDVQFFDLPAECIPQTIIYSDEKEIDVLVLSQNSYDHFLYRYDLKSKSFTLENVQKYFNSFVFCMDDYWVYQIKNDDSLTLEITNLLDKSTKTNVIVEKINKGVYDSIYVEDGILYYLNEYNLQLTIYNIEKKQVMEVIDLSEWTRSAIFSLCNDLSVISVDAKRHIICVPDQEYVHVYEKNQKTPIYIPYKNDNMQDNVTLPHTYISSDRKCVYVFSQNEVMRYSFKDDSIQSITVDFYFTLEENQKMQFYEKSSYIDVLSGDNLLMLMDDELFGQVCWAKEIEAVDVDNNRIYVCSKDGLAYYKFYSFDEILQLGRKRIEGEIGTWY